MQWIRIDQNDVVARTTLDDLTVQPHLVIHIFNMKYKVQFSVILQFLKAVSLFYRLEKNHKVSLAL